VPGFPHEYLDSQLARAASRLRLRVGGLITIAVGFGAATPVWIALHAYLIALFLFVCAIAALMMADAQKPVLPLALALAAAATFGFAVADPTRALAASFLLLGLVLVAICLAASGAGRSSRSAHYMTELAMLAAAIAACLRPDWFSVIAYAGGIVCFPAAGHITARSIVRSV
jgi:hypothetical protein